MENRERDAHDDSDADADAADGAAAAAAAVQRNEAVPMQIDADAAVKDEPVNGSSRSGAAAVASTSQPAAPHNRARGGGVKRSGGGGGGGGAAAAAGGADGDAQPQSKRARLDAPPLSPQSPVGGGAYSGGRDAEGRRHGIGERLYPDGRLYEGEWAAGQRSSFGVEWDAAGRVSACGRWADDELIESRPVPRTKVPNGSRLSEAAKAAPSERTLLLVSGGYYVGDLNAEHQPHGQGTEHRADGSEKASGAWRDGKQHGRGQTIRLGNDSYEGDFADGKWHGLGCYEWSDGVFEGEWAADQRSGLGIRWDKDGKVLQCGRWAQGELLESCPVPRSKIPIGTHLSAAAKLSTLLLSNGGFYCGPLDDDGEPHGHGSLHRADGSIEANGEWAHGRLFVSGDRDTEGRPHGAGVEWSMQGRYEGTFQHGQRQGLGVLTLPNGHVYEGEWAADERSGFGVVWGKKGKMIQCGRWANDEFIETCGVQPSKLPIGAHLSAAAKQADLVCPGGGHYCGALNAAQQPHGQGALFRSDGTEAVRGDWTDGRLIVSGDRDAEGRLHGAGSEWSMLGLYAGSFEHSQRHGLGSMTLLDGRVFEGEWAADGRSGLGVEWDKDGQVTHCGRWASGKLIKACNVPRSKIPVGVKLSAAARAAPPQRTLLMPSGSHYVGDFDADWEPQGHGMQYETDGVQFLCSDWRAGRMFGRGVASWPGVRCYQGDFFDDEFSGLGSWTDEDGTVYEGDFAANVSSGLGIQWAKDGKMTHCGRWANHELVESCAVPRSKVLIGTHLSAAGHRASLLLPDGGFCFGPLNAAMWLHGRGSLHRSDGTEVASGQWTDARLAVSGEKDAEGRLHGEGAEWCPRGLYSGHFGHSERQGLGCLTLFHGGVVEGEWSGGQLSGFGIEWDKDGKVVECGRWEDGECVEERPVPLSKIPVGKHLSAAARAFPVDRTLLLLDGNHYVGDLNEHHQAHGQGTEYHDDGSEFASGAWRDGVLYGRGVMNLEGGDRYEGEFVDGNKQGLGRYAWAASGQVYEGEWKAAGRSGFGIQWDEDGKIFECGRWEDDECVEERPVPLSKIPVGALLSIAARIADPERTLLLPDGGHYVGDFNEEHKAHGQGTSYLADGSESASGAWRDGEQHGRGRRKLLNGASYEGDFADGVKSGLGSFVWADGSRYEGEWAANQRSGFGVEWDKDGKVVKCGRWADNRLAESCVVPRSKISAGAHLSAAAKLSSLLYPDGAFHCGALDEQSRPHGEGTKYGANGAKQLSGSFVHCELDGIGFRLLADGSSYEGEFRAGKQSGFGLVCSRGGGGSAAARVLKCGRWANDSLIKETAVPCSMLLAQGRISLMPHTSLIYPDGGFFCGPLNANFQRHGAGSMHAQNRSVTARGVWVNDALQPEGQQSAAGGAAVGAAAAGPAPAAPAAASSSSSSSSDCTVCLSSSRDCLIDCPHFCLCMDCAAQLDKCPICDVPITRREQRRIIFS